MAYIGLCAAQAHRGDCLDVARGQDAELVQLVKCFEVPVFYARISPHVIALETFATVLFVFLMCATIEQKVSRQ